MHLRNSASGIGAIAYAALRSVDRSRDAIEGSSTSARHIIGSANTRVIRSRSMRSSSAVASKPRIRYCVAPIITAGVPNPLSCAVWNSGMRHAMRSSGEMPVSAAAISDSR